MAGVGLAVLLDSALTSGGLRFSLNCSLCLRHVPANDRNAVAAELGFDTVEYWWPFASATPVDSEIGDFIESVRAAGLRLAALNFPAGDMAAGDRGIMSHRDAINDFRNGVRVAADIGRELGTTVFNALYGLADPAATTASAADVAIENLQFAAEYVHGLGAVVVIEPLSGAETYPIKTAHDAIEVLHQAGRANVAVLADLYHLAMNGDDPGVVIERDAASIGHVQIADLPGRGAPGTGSLPLGHYLDALWRQGYAGHIGLEFVSSGDIDADLAWLPRYRRADKE